MSRVTIADDGNVWLNGRLTRWVMLRDSGEWKGVRASLAEGGRVVVRCASERELLAWLDARPDEELAA
jgi:hypothetical protein